MSWTEARVELLRKLWGDGFSASRIAGELGMVTRNAVIGKIHRLGIASREKAAEMAQQLAQAKIDNSGGNDGSVQGGQSLAYGFGGEKNPDSQALGWNNGHRAVASGVCTVKNEGMTVANNALDTIQTIDGAIAKEPQENNRLAGDNGEEMSEESIVNMYRKLSVLELTEMTCKWPVGDPSGVDFFFCGQRTDGSSPYCRHHAHIAYPAQGGRRSGKIQ